MDALPMLLKEMEELDHITSKEWYAERMNYVVVFRKLDWDTMLGLFRCTDAAAHNQTIQLIANMIAILMQWQVGIMCLPQYQFIVKQVHEIVQYYHKCTIDALVTDMKCCEIAPSVLPAGSPSVLQKKKLKSEWIIQRI